MRFLSKLILVAAACALLSLAIASANEYEPVGGKGDRHDVDMCAPGSFMVGARYRSGDWMDQMQLGCAVVKPDGTLAPTTFTLPVRGGNGGGAPRDKTCPPNKVVVGMEYVMTEGNKEVRYVKFTCAFTNMQSPEAIGFGGGNTSFGTAYPHQPCGPNQAGWGVKINSGKYVNALGLICARMFIPKPKGPVKPDPNEAWSTNISDFHGAFATTTSQHASYALSFSPACDGSVTGIFVNSNPQYSGSLHGTVSGGKLAFTWKQKSGATGTGTFKVYADGRLDGQIVYRAPGATQPTLYWWRGNRTQRANGPDCTATAGGVGGGVGGGGGGDPVPAEWADMLAAHNEKRAAHCVGQLTWSTKLAADAQEWAEKCTLSHSGVADGESIAYFVTTGGDGQPVLPAKTDREAYQNSWYCEIQWYHYDDPKWFGGTKNGCDAPINGHFTQAVWNTTTQVGCGRKTCSGGTYWVCRYSPAGNVSVDETQVSHEVAVQNLKDHVKPVCKTFRRAIRHHG